MTQGPGAGALKKERTSGFYIAGPQPLIVLVPEVSTEKSRKACLPSRINHVHQASGFYFFGVFLLSISPPGVEPAPDTLLMINSTKSNDQHSPVRSIVSLPSS